MPPMISVIGQSGSGKTTLIEKLVPELKKRGYRIGTIKHASKGFEIDQEGKDSWRHKAAGAGTVLVASPGRIAMVKDDNWETLSHLEKYLQNLDLVITEGFKKEDKPQIAVCRKTDTEAPPCQFKKDYLFAFVTDTEINLNVPKFRFDEVKELADLIEEKFL